MAAQDRAAAEYAKTPSGHLLQVMIPMTAGLIALGTLVLSLWQRWFVLFPPNGTGGYETAWNSYGVDGGQLGREGYVLAPVLGVLGCLLVDDFRRICQRREARWERPRTVIAVAVFVWMAGGAITADPFGYRPLTLQGALIGIGAITVVTALQAHRPDPNPRRLVGVAAVLIAGTLAMANLLQFDAPGRVEQCSTTVVVGFTSQQCATQARGALVNGMPFALVGWVAGWTVLVVAVRRWKRSAPVEVANPRLRGTFEGGRRPLAVLVVVVALAVASVGSSVVTEVAVARNWCTDVRPTRWWTAHANCDA